MLPAPTLGVIDDKIGLLNPDICEYATVLKLPVTHRLTVLHALTDSYALIGIILMGIVGTGLCPRWASEISTVSA